MFLQAALLVSATLLPARLEEPVTVCAAVSLTESLEAAAEAYKRAGAGSVRFNFAGSNVLARQLANGGHALVACTNIYTCPGRALAAVTA